MKASRDFFRFYLIPVVLLAGILVTAGFTLYYAFTARTRDGRIVGGNWPKEFTQAFSRQLVPVGDALTLTEAGEALLDSNGLWLQALDASGKEILSCRKPAQVPEAYRAAELLRLYQNGWGEYSVFFNDVAAGDASCTYLIGFPIAISKVVMYVDAARYQSGKALIFAVVALTALLVITLSVYSYRTFYAAESRRARDERAKEEWLANITHDLKTPLAPIRGYGELLAEGDALPEGDTRRYGAIILKNALYTEELVDDLKLTYQLQSGMLPLNRETRNVARFVREVLIDILNAPEYEGRAVAFTADGEERECSFDERLLRRALTNVIVNALKHNKPAAELSVSLGGASEVLIRVADTGGGMTRQELEGLFQRYYRGANTETKAEGSGLGMAIAKQIIEAHGGRIWVESQPGAGTTVTIRLPGELRIK